MYENVRSVSSKLRTATLPTSMIDSLDAPIASLAAFADAASSTENGAQSWDCGQGVVFGWVGRPMMGMSDFDYCRWGIVARQETPGQL